METTTIKVNTEIRTKLMEWKYKLGCSSVSEVIDRILSIVPADKLK